MVVGSHTCRNICFLNIHNMEKGRLFQVNSLTQRNPIGIIYKSLLKFPPVKVDGTAVYLQQYNCSSCFIT